MRVLIVEDSAEDRLNLRTLLDNCPDITAIEEAADLDSARKILTKQALDVLFLDVQLGHESGFELIDVSRKLPCVILTTVHRELGDQAFDANATDYIIKPVTEERLLRALRRVAVRLGKETDSPTRVPVHRSGSERRLVALTSIVGVVAEGNCSRIYSDAEEYRDHRSLREWEALLNGYGFERLDRSTLLGPDQMKALQLYGKGARITFHRSPAVFEIGRTALVRLQEILAGTQPGQNGNGTQPETTADA
jgi:DNA-binding LytR/AlgR family response regulator